MHRKQNIRQALFIYLSITLDKLDSWTDFWPSQRSGCNEASPKIAKHHHTDLDSFDKFFQLEVTRAAMHMNLYYEKEATQYQYGEEQYDVDTAKLEFELRLGTLTEILSGARNVQADTEAALKRLSETYQPKIEEMESLFDMLEEEMSGSERRLSSSPISQAVKNLVPVGRDIQQRLETQLGELHGARNQRESGCDVDLLIKMSLEFMVAVDYIYSEVTTLIDGRTKMVEDMSE